MLTMTTSRRTTILVGVLAGCLAIAGVGDLLWALVAQPLVERQAKLCTLQQTIAQQQTQILAIRAAEVKQRAWQACTLSADVSQATTRYQHWLAAQLRELQLERAVVTPGVAHVRGDHFWVPVQIETEVSPTTFATLITRLEGSSVLQRVRRVHLQAMGLGNREQLKVSLQVEALALTGSLQATLAMDRDPFAHAPPASTDPAPLGELLAQRNPFAIVGPLVSNAVAELPSPTEAPNAAEIMSEMETVARPELKLVGILVQTEKKRAWLYDSTTQQQHILLERQIVALPVGEIEVIAIQPLFVELRVQRQQLRLMLGETLSMPAVGVEQTASTELLAMPAP